jgi:uncharacterized protein
MQYDFLYALEVSGCVSAKSGWKPHHLMVSSGENIVAVMPLYLKYHSYGEYIFDFSWAQAYEQHGIGYYPKLLSSIPFVPASGIRLAYSNSINTQEIFKFVSESLRALSAEHGYSSIHILLSDKNESENWNISGFKRKINTQFHWFNSGYETFDHFLETLNSRKRKAVKKERASIYQYGIEVEVKIGREITSDLWDIFFDFYRDTYQKRSGHSGYLNREFFRSLTDPILAQTMVVFAKREAEYIAGALYFFSDTTLYGRHWGCTESIDVLHFELCYYSGIQFCIKYGLQKFEAGAQGEHKIQRGFIPSEVYSNHWVLDSRFESAINQNILEESRGNLNYIEEMKAFLPFKKAK